jgi:hypothetical protein
VGFREHIISVLINFIYEETYDAIDEGLSEAQLSLVCNL